MTAEEQEKLEQKREAYYRSKRYTTDMFSQAYVAAISGLCANSEIVRQTSHGGSEKLAEYIACTARRIAVEAVREYLECLDCIG